MPIAKNRSADGLVRRCTCGDEDAEGKHYGVSCIHTIASMEADSAIFGGWVAPTPEVLGSLSEEVRLQVRTDYEVNGDGKLIRLGNQIDEELYPAWGLRCIQEWYDPDGKVGQTERAYSSRERTVAQAQLRASFVRWADTPRNRELGLFKEETNPVNDRQEKIIPFDEHDMKEAFKAANECDLGKYAEDLVAHVSSRQGEAYLKDTKNALPLRCGFKYFSVGGDSVDKESMADRLIRVTTGLDIWVCNYFRDQNRAESLVDQPTGLTVKGDGEGGCTMVLKGVRRRLETPTEFLLEEEAKRKAEAKKSLGDPNPFEETSWLKAKLPDGRIVESPMPSAKDRWYNYEHHQWQAGDCFMQGTLPCYPADGYYFCRPRLVQPGDPTMRLHRGHEALRVWWEDFGPQLVIERLCVLEAKKFRREIKINKTLPVLSDIFYNVGNDEAAWTRQDGLTARYRRENFSNPDWPEGRHPKTVIK